MPNRFIGHETTIDTKGRYFIINMTGNIELNVHLINYGEAKVSLNTDQMLRWSKRNHTGSKSSSQKTKLRIFMKPNTTRK